MGRREEIKEGLAMYCDDVDGALKFLHSKGVVMFIDGSECFSHINEPPYHPNYRAVGCTFSTETLIEVEE